MVNIRNKRCINCNLSRAYKTYNHCAFCFINLFPNDPKASKARSSKELKVVIHILNTCPNLIYNIAFSVDLEGGRCSTKKENWFKTVNQ